MALDLRFVDEAVERIGRAPDAVIPILQALQEHYGYLPDEALRRICDTTAITPAAVTGVSSFYDMFRRQPAGRFRVRVCHGTACHVTGSERVEDALRRELHIPDGEDTDANRQFTIEPVACLGCCTLAPVVKVDQNTFGHVTAEKLPGVIRSLLSQDESEALAGSTEETRFAQAGIPQIHVGLGSCCMAKGSDQLFHALQDSAHQAGVNVAVKRVGCVGMCHRTPLIEVALPGRPSSFYAGLDSAQARDLVLRHFRPTGFKQGLLGWWRRALDGLLLDGSQEQVARHELDVREPDVSAFLDKQVRIATELFGQADPLDLDEYVGDGGFSALARCLSTNVPTAGQPPLTPALSPNNGEGTPRTAHSRIAPPNPLTRPSGTLSPSAGERGFWFDGFMGSETAPLLPSPNLAPTTAKPPPLKPDDIITLIERSGLRGRGGAGFPTGPKWRLARQQPGPVKYVICNGDEGDPGAFMDRMLLESFPYRIIEGLAIAAVAMGAHEGIFYIRHEYPLAVKRVRAAIKLCQQRGWVGESLLGTDYALKLSIKEGAGAFVCGEETALIASIEGQRGMPELRPPYPVEQGLWGKPTVINNVETLALVPWIIRHGAEAFARHGTATSKGTKVFALAGNILRGGLIEVPMGLTIREIVEDIGGGVGPGRRFKAVQIGGPSGGCVPARLADTPVDYESLRAVGAIMGSGGLIVLDDTACMVDIARYMLQFTQDQSCGKCTFCRIGTRRMLDILERLCEGKGRPQDLTELEHLGNQVGAGSLCGLGKTAPNPILTTLRYFRDEYEAHIQGHCPAGKCTSLIQYRVLENCTGCTLCAQHCPVDAIPMVPYQRHHIDVDLCTRCDSCRRVCPENAIEVV